MSLLGHVTVAEQIIQGFKSNTTAVLLTGPSGVGKQSVARYVVSELFEPYSNDVVWSEHSERSFGVDQMRSLLKVTDLQPKSDFRLIVLSQADTLTDEAADAFLKTLEDGTGQARFMLISSEPVRDTIRSRCEEFVLSPLPDDIVRQILVEHGVPAKSLDVCVSGALGLPGRGLRFGDASLVALRQKALEVLRAAIKAPMYEIPALLDPVGDDILVEFINEALSILVDAARCRFGGPDRVHSLDIVSELPALGDLYVDGLFTAIERLSELYRVSDIPLQFRYHLTVLFMTMRVLIRDGAHK